MRKGFITMGAVLMLAVLTTGCQQVTSLTSGLADGFTDTIAGSIDPERLYYDLSSLINSPEDLENSIGNDYLGRRITFTAMAVTDPEVIEFDEDEGGNQTYILAVISRNIENGFYLNVEGIDEKPAAGDIIEITGVVEGYIYEVIDNENVKALDITAEKIAVKELEENPSLENNIKVTKFKNSGSFQFRNAQLSENEIILYYEFTNGGEEGTAPLIDKLEFMQGDAMLTRSSKSSAIEVDPQALEGSLFNIEKTLPGKTFLYYVVLRAEDHEIDLTTDPIQIYQYDDEFNCLNEYELPVEAEEVTE